MIKRLDIANFGSFFGFDWKSLVRRGQEVSEFRRLNILFGRNYSGKTTLSRIFRSLEVGRFPHNYPDPDFEIFTDNGTLTHQDISSHSLDIRVYNTDFVNENLSFLTNETEGEVRTFAIIGSENKETERRIRKIEDKLGDAEEETGKRYELARIGNEYSEKKLKAEKAKEALEEKLRRHANDKIKRNKKYGYVTYNINSIKEDIKTARKESVTVLEASQVVEKEKLLEEKPLPSIDTKVFFSTNFKTLYEDSVEILGAKIKPSEPIQELLNDSVLQAWVKDGMGYHKERSSCGFCGQFLTKDRWEELNAHFSKESSDLEEKIKERIKSLEEEVKSLSEIDLPAKESFYESVRSAFEDAEKKFRETLSDHRNENQKLLENLKARQKDIFTPKPPPDFEDFSEKVGECVDELNTVIEPVIKPQLTRGFMCGI